MYARKAVRDAAADSARPAPQRSVGAAEPAQAPAPARHRLASIGLPGGDVIQRAIGFEYELGGVRTYEETGWIRHVPVPLKKRTEIAPERNGFKITADDPPTGSTDTRSDLELIIDPPIDDTKDGARADAARRLTAMQNFVAALGLAGAAATGNKVQASTYGGSRNHYFDVPPNSFATGQLQVSAGLDLRALANVRSGAAATAADNRATALQAQGPVPRRLVNEVVTTMNGAGGQSDGTIWTASLAAARTILGNAVNRPDIYVPQLAAVMSMIVTIPTVARTANNVPYAKTTSANLLARTDFATTLGLLSNAVRGVLVRRKAAWSTAMLDIVKTESGDATLTLASPVFPAQIGTAPQIQLTMGEWFSGLASTVSVDQLTEADYPQDYGEEQGEQLESLGGFGSRTDAPLRDQARRAIFEFRQLPAVGSTEIADRGLGVWDYVMRAHGRTPPS
ncbi:MAG: hypothetical protein JWO85_1458 [Candidatus Eremiobacteraeota bacterium]|nr:hypothetical protein [Candidatus Eremiobacteraeota bacterium]